MTESRVLGRDNRVQLSTYPAHQVHYKTNSLIISRIIRLELVVRTIGLVVRTIRLIVRTISSPWDPGG